MPSPARSIPAYSLLGTAMLLMLMAGACTADEPDTPWWQHFLPPTDASTQRPDTPAMTLTARDIAMAQQLIHARTLTVPSAVPGGSSRVGPGPLTAADRLVLYSLKMTYLQGLPMPPTWFRQALAKTGDSAVHRKAAEAFWTAYIQTPPRQPVDNLRRALKQDFGWYLDTKMTERLVRSNRRMGLRQQAHDVWQHAVDAERSITTKWAQREQAGRLARDAYQKGWAADDANWHAQQMERQYGSGEQVTAAKHQQQLATEKAHQAQSALKQYGGSQ